MVDPSGAAKRGAGVSVTRVGTGLARNTVSDSTGSFESFGASDFGKILQAREPREIQFSLSFAY